jgi:hypothetical protein
MQEAEYLLRRVIKEEVKRLSRSPDVVIKRYVREAIAEGMLTEWDIALQYARGGSLLSESQEARGRLLVESLFQGTVEALKWAGQKIGKGVQAILSAGGEALDAAGKALMSLLEMIPGGRSAFEFLKDFSGEAADKIEGAVVEAAKEFGEFIDDKKEEILSAVFKAGAEDTSVVEDLRKMIEAGEKKLGGDAEKVKEWFEDFKKDQVKAAKDFFQFRQVLGVIVQKAVEKILAARGDVAKKITGVFESAGFTKSKLGMFFLRVLSFFSGDMGGEETIEAAGKMWSAGKKLGSGKVDIEHRGRALVEIIPKMVKGLVGGTSALEGVVRAAAGDPKALTDLFKNAIGLVTAALKKVVKASGVAAVKAADVDPEGRLGKTVTDAVVDLLGTAAE